VGHRHTEDQVNAQDSPIRPLTDSPIRRERAIDRLIEASARNKFLVFIFTIFAVAAGIYGLIHTPLDAIPDLSDVQVIVYAEWEGRSPDLVEDQITYPISTVFIAAPKVKFVRGESMFGKSFIYVIFEDGTDIYWARSRVIEYLNSVRGSLPEGVNPVIGPDATGVGWIYEYALVDDTGKHDLAQLRSIQDWNLRYALSSVKGVAEVAPVGGFVKQYQVDLDPNALVAYSIPLSDIVNAIKTSNADVGGKTFEVATTEYYIRGRGYIKKIEDIENIVLKVENGTPVYLKNVGNVHLGADLRRGVAELDGRGEVVGGIIVMRYGENALNVIDAVKKKIEEIKPSLPVGVRIVPVYDRSDLIKRAIATLREKLIEESVVVALVCLVFLWHVRSALVAIITLPIAIILSFIPMWWWHVTSNIMSLGGIAIAIGAMVDSAIIMIENAHKQLEAAETEKWRNGETETSPTRPFADLPTQLTYTERVRIIIDAAKGVGRSLFFALLVITVSFVPVFSLTAQEGRLFRPLAFTKTFSMFFASFLGVTLVPVLMTLLIRGKITPEEKNPVNRFLIRAYHPVADFVLRYRWFTLIAAFVVLLITIFPYKRLGSEFMPPLNEGTLLYMPTAVPGMAIDEATKILQIQDRRLKKIPEAVTVFGKAGQADTPTDPAPLSMFETVVALKPPNEWRRGMTWDKLLAEVNTNMKTPGMANIFWMPIQTRTEMLTTGFRSVLGVKVFGPDLGEIQKLAVQIEKELVELPDTRSAFAERTVGGYFLDFTVNREAAARYGLKVGDVNDIVESAIGGKNITTTVEGRERYPVNTRYARDFREDLDALKRVLVPTPTGAQVPISMLADIHYKTGPPSVRSENGKLVGFVFVDITTSDIEGYARKASQLLAQRIQYPPDYYIEWAGQFQYLLAAKERLKVVVPFTLLIIFVLLYFSTRSVTRTLIVLLTVPFSLVGAFWLLYVLGYNMSVAVWVGLIALAGVSAETGVVMLLYLDHAWDKFKAEGRMNRMKDLHDAVMEGAVQRIRPKIMTVCAILFGLLPIMWSPMMQAGADVMKRIATPMIGGIITSAILELLIFPVIYVNWRKRELEDQTEAAAPLIPPELVPSERTRQRLPKIIAFIVAIVLILFGGKFVWQKIAAQNAAAAQAAPIATQTVNDLTVKLYGQVRKAPSELLIEFHDANGQLVDVGDVKMEANMNMPGMQMHAGATVQRSGSPGQYRAKIKPDMTGDWVAKLSFNGPHGNGQTSFNLNVKQ
jgi:copper/silver efflux system protein